MSDTPKLDWIGEKILKQEEPFQHTLPTMPEGEPSTPPELPGISPPHNAAAEQQAFADLLAALNDTDEGDADTLVTVLSADDFAAESFIPDNPKETMS